MEPVTVKQLLAYLESEQQKGHGDYVIFVTDDEEANGYHALWYLGETAEEISIKKYIESINCDLSVLKDKNKAIYMG